MDQSALLELSFQLGILGQLYLTVGGHIPDR